MSTIINVLGNIHMLFSKELLVVKAKLDEILAKLRGWNVELVEAERDFHIFEAEDLCPWAWDGTQSNERDREQWYIDYYAGCDKRRQRIEELHEWMTALHSKKDDLVAQIRKLEQ